MVYDQLNGNLLSMRGRHDWHEAGWGEDYSRKQSPLFSVPPFLLFRCITASVTSSDDSLTACKSHHNLYLFLQLSVFHNLLAVHTMVPITVKQDYSNRQNLKTTGIKSPLFLPSENVVLLLYLRLWERAGGAVLSLPADATHPQQVLL